MNQADVLVDRTVTETLMGTKHIRSRTEAIQTDLQDLHKDLHSIQEGQDRVQEMIASGEDTRSQDFDTLASLIDRKIERATSRLEADMQVIQTILHNIFYETRQITTTEFVHQGKFNRKGVSDDIN